MVAQPRAAGNRREGSGSRIHLCGVALLSVASLLLGCAGQTPGGRGPTGRLAVSVAPLSLAGIVDADYTITVTNGANGAGDVVWTKDLASSRHGDGAGSLSYVGTCDAATGVNTVRLALTALFDASGEIPPGDYLNPSPIALEVSCVEGADVAVDFDVTVVRQADQGFFDITVNFDDLFCSAKLDCVDGAGNALKLLHDATGARAQTAVLALACTADPSAATSYLYLDDLLIQCSDLAQDVHVDPSGQGLIDLSASPNVNAGGYLFAAAVYRGYEELAGKAYWNVALGLDADGLATAGTCTLVTRATASSVPFPQQPQGFPLPEGAVWPVIDWSVTLSADGARVCTRDAVNAPGSQVVTDYLGFLGAPNAFTWANQPVWLQNRFEPTTGIVVHATGACPDGFTGASCEIDVDDCATPAGGPCQNGGTCSDGVASFSCACPTGFTGDTCETNIDDCATPNGGPCQNGGTCSDGVASFSCACPNGFSGHTCATNIDDCAPNPCQNGGACSDGVASFTCSCPTGFTGDTCATNIDDCAPNPCANGTCVDGVASFGCACDAGWTGTRCDQVIDNCDPNPCLNGGTCTNGIDTATCTCADGFTGADCGVNINDCATPGGSPCLNGGACNDGVASYTCSCQSGFGGATCDTDIRPSCTALAFSPAAPLATDDITCSCAAFASPVGRTESGSTCAFTDLYGTPLGTPGACVLPAAAAAGLPGIACALTPSDGDAFGDPTIHALIFPVGCAADPSACGDDGVDCTRESCTATYAPASRKPCSALAFGSPSAYGSATICGESDAPSLGGACSGALPHEDAVVFCAAAGARLCTKGELEANETKGSGCNYDSARVWTSTPCDGGFWTAAGSSDHLGAFPATCSAPDAGDVYARCCADTTTAPATLGCASTPDDSLCDDGGACTIDVCDPARGGCQHGANTATVCDDGVDCTVDGCPFACPPEQIFRNSCYRLADWHYPDGTPVALPWTEIYNYTYPCEVGQLLVQVDDAEENEFVRGLIATAPAAFGSYAWIGLGRLAATDPYVWWPSHDVPGYTHWGDGQPGPFSTGDSTKGVVMSSVDGAWYAGDGYVEAPLWVCEWPAVAPGADCGSTPQGSACDDDDACTTDVCDPVLGCTYTAVSCDDGLGCTVDTCDHATGCANTPDDGYCPADGATCTREVCDPAHGCKHVADAASCTDPDGDLCTPELCSATPTASARACSELGWSGGGAGSGAEVCAQSAHKCGTCCVAHGTPGCAISSCESCVCNAQDSCCSGSWDQSCADLAIGACAASCSSGACSGEVAQGVATALCERVGGRLCTVDELLRNEVQYTNCGYGYNRVWTSEPCGDGAFMTAPAATAALGSLPLACTPADAAGVVASCCADADPTLVSGCHQAAPTSCSDGLGCTVDTCDPATGGCTNTPDDAACDDGVDCSGDVCNPSTGCQHTENDASCADTDQCTFDACVLHPCPADATIANGSCYQAVCGAVGWNTARNACIASGGHLVSIDGDAENTLVRDVATATCGDVSVWTGLHKNMYSDWVWQDGAPDSYRHWSSGQPISTMQAAYVDAAGYWGTSIKSNPKPGYVCEYDTTHQGAAGCANVPLTCANGDCSQTAAPACDDGDACTAGDQCESDLCVATAAVDCDDGVACTLDACDPDTGCVHTPDDSACDDGIGCSVDTCDPLAGCSNTADDALCAGNPCTIDDACLLRLCPAGATVSNGSCYQAVCDALGWNAARDACAAAGAHLVSVVSDAENTAVRDVVSATCGDVNAWIGLFLNPSFDYKWVDGSPTAYQRWASGQPNYSDAVYQGVAGNWLAVAKTNARPAYVCEYDTPISSDPGCYGTPLTCDNGGDCSATVAPACDDGDVCTTASQCVDGVCEPSAVVDCDDGVACTLDSCDPAAGCLHVPDDSPCAADASACTDAVCDVVAGCQQVPNDANCDDGDGCTTDHCVAPTVSDDTCSTLRWNPDAAGGPDVCAESSFGGSCSGYVTQSEAASTCAANHARLCTVDELLADEAEGSGCSYNQERVWSSTPCAYQSVWTAAGATAFADTVPKACTPVSEAAGVMRCCADVTPLAVPPQCVPAAIDCDDGVACTVDSCDPALPSAEQVCTSFPADDACTGGQVCDPSAGCQ